MKKLFIGIMLLVAALLGGWSGFFPCAEAAPEKDDFPGVRAKVDAILDDGTEYAVFLAYPGESDEAFLYNSHPMRSASMIKVFIMAAAMEKVAAGEMSLDDEFVLRYEDKVGGSGILAGYADGSVLSFRTLLDLMIAESDNTATNMIIQRMGMGTINDYIKRKGYKDTILQREMMDMDAIAAGRENYSSVRDLGDIFMLIYHHRCVDPARDEIMLDFLKGQTDTDCFPAALPGRVIAHKTGALPGLFDDGGIIYGGERDTVLVIMTEDFTSEDIATERMKSFAAAVAQ